MFLAPTRTLVGQDLSLAWLWTSPIAAGKPYLRLRHLSCLNSCRPEAGQLFHFLLRQDRCLLLRQDRCLLLRQDRCVLLGQDRCLLLRQDRCRSLRYGARLPSSNRACPKPGQAQILADQSSGPVQRHQIWPEMGRESTVWPETWSRSMPGPFQSLWDGSNPLQGAVPGRKK